MLLSYKKSVKNMLLQKLGSKSAQNCSYVAWVLFGFS
jgi:hypothetical protein